MKVLKTQIPRLSKGNKWTALVGLKIDWISAKPPQKSTADLHKHQEHQYYSTAGSDGYKYVFDDHSQRHCSHGHYNKCRSETNARDENILFIPIYSTNTNYTNRSGDSTVIP